MGQPDETKVSKDDKKLQKQHEKEEKQKLKEEKKLQKQHEKDEKKKHKDSSKSQDVYKIWIVPDFHASILQGWGSPSYPPEL